MLASQRNASSSSVTWTDLSHERGPRDTDADSIHLHWLMWTSVRGRIYLGPKRHGMHPYMDTALTITAPVHLPSDVWTDGSLTLTGAETTACCTIGLHFVRPLPNQSRVNCHVKKEATLLVKENHCQQSKTWMSFVNRFEGVCALDFFFRISIRIEVDAISGPISACMLSQQRSTADVLGSFVRQ